MFKIKCSSDDAALTSRDAGRRRFQFFVGANNIRPLMNWIWWPCFSDPVMLSCHAFTFLEV